MKKIKISLCLILSSIPTIVWAYCPTPDTEVRAEVEVSVEFNSLEKLYTYNYEVSNVSDSKLKLNTFGLFIDHEPVSFKRPQWWSESFIDYKDNNRPKFSWSTVREYINRGASKADFSITSRLPPGVVEFYTKGKTGLPVIMAPVNGDSEVEPDCPGFFYD
ncbi:MAG: hypothetical protein KC478_13440, partial [Bacteriovoracaceae bacterium]|nr:hypothetical protein [Bacteriovoracaceae bacterium]